MFARSARRALRAGSLCLVTALLIYGCANNPQLNSLGTTILTSAGLSGSQAQSLMSAGEHGMKAAEGLTEEEEYYLGRGVSAMILAKYPPLRNAALNAYVTKVGTVIAKASDRPETFGGYHFQVLDSEEINAFAAPGGFIFVTKGFLRLVPDEDALAAVLAHEVGHIVAGDGVKAISGANLTKALSILGKQALSDTVSAQGGAALGELTNAFGDSVDDIFETMVTSGYSRSQEYGADAYAQSLLERTGYNPQALPELLERMAKADRSGGMFSTHPDAGDRKEELDGGAGEASAIAGMPARQKRFRSSVGRL